MGAGCCGRPDVDEPDHWHRRLLRARSHRPSGGRAAEQRDELAAFPCPIPPVLPTERIAHLGTADCCIHPPWRNEIIAITRPKICSKEVAQNRPPHSAPATSLTRNSPHQISGDEGWMKI